MINRDNNYEGLYENQLIDYYKKKKCVYDFANDISKFVNGVPSNIIDEVHCNINCAQRIFLIGNGGSAAICDHIANDLIKRCEKKAFTLSSYPLLTCLANDYDFENMYTKWLDFMDFSTYWIRNFASIEVTSTIPDYLPPKDMLIAISSSGKSEDIVRPMKTFINTDCYILGISGFNGFDDMICNRHIHFPSDNYGIVEMATEVLLHGIVEALAIGE